MFYYTLFGYVVASDFEFPQLVKTEEREEDIRIAKGEIPEVVFLQEAEKRYEFRENVSWLVNDTCYLYVEGGTKITYQLKNGGEVKNLRNYVMGWGMSMLGMQRGIIAMHCSVVSSENGAILISGESGAGKSTLTNILLDNGWSFMADDMAYVETKSTGEVVVKPAFPYQKLCRDVAKRKGYLLEELIYIDEDKDKFLVPYKGEFKSCEMPVKALVVLLLSRRGHVEVTELTGLEKYMACTNNQFLRHLLKQDKYKGVIGRECLRMSQGIRVFVIERPAEGDSLKEITSKALALVKELL